MIFSFYNPIQYTASTITPNASPVLMTQIFKNYESYFRTVLKRYRLTSYYIQGAPRPEELSNELYGNPQLYWVLLMCNNIYDPFHGWIKSQEAVYESVRQQHPTPGISYHKDLKGEKYYNLTEKPGEPGVWYDIGDKYFEKPQYYGALAAVSWAEDAILQNEQKRRIKIISPSDIDNFIADLIKEMERN